MLLEHAAEIIAIRETAVLRNLLDRLLGVAEEVAGAVEPVAEEDAHRCHADLGAKEVIEIANANPSGAGGVVSINAAGEVALEELHRFADPIVELLIGPRFGRQLGEGVDDESGGLPVIRFPLGPGEGFEEAARDLVDG